MQLVNIFLFNIIHFLEVKNRAERKRKEEGVRTMENILKLFVITFKNKKL